MQPETVTYTHAGATISVLMSFAGPSFADGTTDAVGLVKAAELMAGKAKFTPRIGDEIQRGQMSYTVDAPLLGFSCYGYSKPDGIEMRIHLKENK